MIPPSDNFELLIARLEKQARESPQMVQAMVELTYGCNLRCVHCYNPTHEAKNEIPTEKVWRILDGLAGQGCLWVGFTGGEIFTRKDAFQIFDHAKSLGLVISLLTNATLITPDRADQIKALDPLLVDISVYGASPETYERVTGVPGSFKKFAQGVDLLLERGVHIILKLVLMTLNVHELDAMREFAACRKVPYKMSTEIFPKVDGSPDPLAYRLSPEQAFEVWRKVSGERLLGQVSSAPEEEENCHGSAGPLFNCACGKSMAAVTPQGKMNLCLSTYTPQFDLTENTVEEGWKELVDLVAGARPGPDYECNHCDLYRQCTRGTKDSWTAYGKFDGPCLTHFRETAQRKADFLEAGLK